MSTEQVLNDLAERAWFKSSYSGSDGGNCVEAAATPTTMHVRDSKALQGPALRIPATQWTTFIAFVSS
ncbi:DUF397 domain-containing protein [Streptomyces sp. NPDC088725]|uniref:DUF397 domain-containing protein n=1 Tax=Streptomyces sp. NPDC088725 TaxID=3365873 RepID=UPI003821488D